MKHCPHCGIQVGGSGDYCPLCQNALVGQGEAPHWPAPKGVSRRKVLLFQLILFLALGAVLVCCVLDFVMLEAPHRHWSIPVLVYVLAGLDLVRVLFRGRYNGPSLSFRVLMGVILLAIYTDWFFHLGGVSIDLIIPALCGASMLLNFLFAFVNTRFTANALVYLLLNITIGVLPYVLLLFNVSTGRFDQRSIPWIVCLIISLITFLGLVIFKGRTLKEELYKRWHL